MAFIVNKPNTSKFQEMGHQLMNHAPVSEMYGYNSTIMELNRLSKLFYTKYISCGREHWKSILNTAGMGSMETYEMPITQFKDMLEEDHATKVYFSIMEIVDAFDVMVQDDCAPITQLQDYIDLGLFPLVSAPMASDQIYQNFEKWDNLRMGRETAAIGTIIDINIIQENEKKRYMATIMWHPDAIGLYGEEIIRPKNGFLKLVDLTQTPKIWYNLDTNFSMVNIGVPIFEFTPFRQMVTLASFVDGFEDYLNEALVTGHLHFDFVQTLLDNMNKTMSEVSKLLPDPNDGAESPAEPIPEEGVAFENASEDDEFGHRLRLYASDYDNIDPNEEYTF